MAYSDKVLDHYNNPRNVGSLDKNDPNVGTGMVGAPECGDVMKLQIKVNEETGIIDDAKFKTFGCGSAIASSSLATEWLKGKTVDEALEIKNTEIVNELSLPPGEDPLLGAGRGRHQGGHRRLQEEEERHRSAGRVGGRRGKGIRKWRNSGNRSNSTRDTQGGDQDSRRRSPARASPAADSAWVCSAAAARA